MPILGHRVEHGVDGGVCQVVSEARNLRDCHSYCFNGNERQFWSSLAPSLRATGTAEAVARLTSVRLSVCSRAQSSGEMMRRRLHEARGPRPHPTLFLSSRAPCWLARSRWHRAVQVARRHNLIRSLFASQLLEANAMAERDGESTVTYGPGGEEEEGEEEGEENPDLVISDEEDAASTEDETEELDLVPELPVASRSRGSTFAPSSLSSHADMMQEGMKLAATAVPRFERN